MKQYFQRFKFNDFSLNVQGVATIFRYFLKYLNLIIWRGIKQQVFVNLTLTTRLCTQKYTVQFWKFCFTTQFVTSTFNDLLKVFPKIRSSKVFEKSVTEKSNIKTRSNYTTTVATKACVIYKSLLFVYTSVGSCNIDKRMVQKSPKLRTSNPRSKIEKILRLRRSEGVSFRYREERERGEKGYRTRLKNASCSRNRRMGDKRGKKRVQRSPGGRHVVGAKFNNAVSTRCRPRGKCVHLAPRPLSLEQRFMYGEVRPLLVSSSRPEDVPRLERTSRENSPREKSRGTRWNGNELSSTVCSEHFFSLDDPSIFDFAFFGSRKNCLLAD